MTLSAETVSAAIEPPTESRRPANPPTTWWKWVLFGVAVTAFCVTACWLDGASAGVHVMRDVKQWSREKREEQQARENAQLQLLTVPAHSGAAVGTTLSSGPSQLQPTILAPSGELETKGALERLLGVPFAKVRPDWLRNTTHMTGRNLEIDCYNEAVGVAVEYSGPQHFMYPNPFHSSPDEFAAQIQRDALKRQVCERRGLVFIVVPHTVKRSMIELFLRTELTQRGLLATASS